MGIVTVRLLLPGSVKQNWPLRLQDTNIEFQLKSFVKQSVQYCMHWTNLNSYISLDDTSHSIHNQCISDNSIQRSVGVGDICCLAHAFPQNLHTQQFMEYYSQEI